MADEILLSGQRVVPRKLLEQGYTFAQPKLSHALADLIANAAHSPCTGPSRT